MKGNSIFFAAQQKQDAAMRLICFPHAGGAPAAFFSWSALLGPQFECVSVQYPGRAQRFRDPALLSMAELVDEISGRWEELPTKPFAFYGHSFGGLLAFEVARRLRRQGRIGPQWLFVGASRAPHLELALPPIHHLPDAAFVDALQVRYGGIPAVVLQDPDILNLFLPPMRADFTAYERYRMEDDAPLSAPIIAFAGAEDRSVTAASMQEWACHTTAEFRLKVLPGGHFFDQGSLSAVLAEIRNSLAGATSGVAGEEFVRNSSTYSEKAEAEVR